MVTYRETMRIIAHTLDSYPNVPDRMSFLLHEADPDGADANVSVPLVEMQATSVSRDDPSNSNFVNFIEDDDGEQVGRAYETKWEMTLQMDIWTADRSDYDVDELGKTMRAILYTYDSRGPGKTFSDEQGEPIDEIYDFSLQDFERNDSMIETPSVRRFRQLARVRGVEELVIAADERPIEQYNIDAQE